MDKNLTNSLIEALAFRYSVKIESTPITGFKRAGHVVVFLSGKIQYSENCFSVTDRKDRANIYSNLLDAVVLASAQGGEVWAVTDSLD